MISIITLNITKMSMKSLMQRILPGRATANRQCMAYGASTGSERIERGQRGGNKRGKSYGRGDYKRHRSREYESSGINPSRTKTLLESWKGDVVYGSSPVLAALDANRRTIHALYVQEGIQESKKKELPAIRQALSKSDRTGIPIIEVSKHDLNMLTNNRPHQGIALDASHLSCEKLDVMPLIDAQARNQSAVWLCLDEITDPQNLGAVIRTAYFLGANGILICSKNSAPLSGVVSKASSGALEKTTIYSCRSLPTTLLDAKVKGWDVVAASGDDGSVACQEFDLGGPTILVMGSEGFGLRKTVRAACTRSIKVDRGNSSLGGLMDVDSLNVSVATGILLHSLLTKRNLL
jgi:21S rRNA (GM2251-2'-O)-methyltransferase